MKQIFFLLLLTLKISFCTAQYSKEKLTGILTGDHMKSWTVSGANANQVDKTYAFSKNQTVQIVKQNGKAEETKWSLNTTDNIRWFITIDNQKQELIVSYDKTGQQYVKLTKGSGNDKTSLYEETLLYPVK